MKVHTHSFLGLKVLVLMGILGIFSTGAVSALTYQQDMGVNFTFNTALSLTLSSSDLHIVNLAPGTASDSNVINVNVLTNSVAGYTLNATVGNSTTYNTRNLIHSNSNISDNFSSIDYTTSPTITTNTNIDTDKWAFSFSTDNGTNWSNYNGLPLYSDTVNIATLKETNGPVSTDHGDDIKFKIAAKASETKPSGDYSNVINFTLVAAPAPISLLDAYVAAGKQQFNGYYKMQDMSSNICDLVEAVDEQLQVIDVRDGKTYWIAKLRDGKCWMTQNLDLDLDTNKTLTHADTDLGWGSVIDTTATWTPSVSTKHYPSNLTTWYWSYWNYTDFSGSNLPPYSLDLGDLYWSGSVMSSATIAEWEAYYSNTDCVVGDFDDCIDGVPGAFFRAGVSSGDAHYHLGNYYDTSAALAVNSITEIVGSNPPEYSSEYVAESSICPAGWTLPSYESYSNNDFVNLLNEYDILDAGDNGSIGLVVEGQNAVAATQTPLYFNLSGFVSSEATCANGVSASGHYHSNHVYYWGVPEDTDTRFLDLEAVTYSESDPWRHVGRSVRCVTR